LWSGVLLAAIAGPRVVSLVRGVKLSHCLLCGFYGHLEYPLRSLH
jgi:hypothetical protein